MRTILLTVLAVLVAMTATTSAEARRYKHTKTEKTAEKSAEWSPDALWGSTASSSKSTNFWDVAEAPPQRRGRHARAAQRVAEGGLFETESSHESVAGVGPRPSAWCGWYMRTRHGGGTEMNLAANWRHYGSPASPQVGAIVVWDHHVGEIVGQASNGQWIVLSGNDSHRVQSRARSIAGATVRI